MNDLHFTGFLESAKVEKYFVTNENGENEERRKVILKIRSEERIAQTLMLTLTGDKAEQFCAIPPSAHRMLVTAYLDFSTYLFDTGSVKKECQRIHAWRLEISTQEGKMYSI